MSEKPAVLFVCLGNICRSPLAEAAFRAEAARAGFDVDVDSAGTGDWHVGEPPDRRAQATARRYGIDIGHYRGRQVRRRISAASPTSWGSITTIWRSFGRFGR